jgi:hypothetical protein
MTKRVATKGTQSPCICLQNSPYCDSTKTYSVDYDFYAALANYRDPDCPLHGRSDRAAGSRS